MTTLQPIVGSNVYNFFQHLQVTLTFIMIILLVCSYLMFFCRSLTGAVSKKTEVCMKCLCVSHPNGSVGDYWVACSFCANWYHNFSCVVVPPASEWRCGACDTPQIYSLSAESPTKKTLPIAKSVTPDPDLGIQPPNCLPSQQVLQDLQQLATESYNLDHDDVPKYGFFQILTRALNERICFC